ncbi:hydantoinase/oxoprolinase family protein [Roseomonas sp. CAU 1739]|uniref:hydantoinase/oxoprolinase family protein n=1 Tax=Roseomonas sp. CAU 1739 TaxID=3140364 RepID=UPI00325B0FE1
MNDTVMTTPHGRAGRYRIGIDIGGTFTDVVVVDQQTGDLRLAKVPSVPKDPAAGFLDGLDKALSRHGIAAGDIAFVGHGTTVATNTIIEGRGARVGLITSEGFSDVLEIAYQTRPDLFDLMYEKPRPLVPRRWTVGVPERIGPDGAELIALDTDACVAAARALQQAGVEVVVIAFLHSYRFPVNENAAAAAIRAVLPDLAVVTSSGVCPEYREYQRTSTAVVNALLLPHVGSYVGRLTEALAQRGAAVGVHLMTSSGGVMSAPVAARFPVQLIESGPAAMALGAAYVAQRAGYPNSVVFDMGGTTAKVALVTNGTPRVTEQFEVGAMAVASDTAGRGRGYPVRTPSVEMVEIGAGGGSIAAIDPGGALGVGPESAGADPGPACYNQGGEEPTIVDANLVLGRLNPDFFLGGEKSLDLARARRAIEERIARPLGATVEEAALAIVEIAVARMAGALHMVTVRRGIDPRGFILVACGGGGPLHAAAIARRAGMSKVLIPTAPGLTSALGLLATDLRHDLVRNTMVRAESADPAGIDAIFTELQALGEQLLAEQAVSRDRMRMWRIAEMCYAGQAFQLRIPLPDGPVTGDVLAGLAQRFHEAHKAAYGFASEGEPTMLMALRLTSQGEIERPTLRPLAKGGIDATDAIKSERRVRLHGAPHLVACPVYDRTRLLAGNVIAGPAVIEQMDTTTLLPPDARATVDPGGNLIIELGAH